LRSTCSGLYADRLRRASSSIFGGNKVELLTSTPVIICGASIVILGVPVAGAATLFSRVPSTASASYRRSRSLGRWGAGYAPGIRRPFCWLSWSAPAVRYPQDWNEMKPDHQPHSERGPVAPHPARLAVGVVGVGRAGTALGVALVRAGHAVVAASAVSEASVARARAAFPEAVITEPAQVLRYADLVLLTVPDDALPGLVAGLAATGAPVQGRMLAHASGRHGLAVLEPATRLGGLPLALHPVMTFTGRADDVDRLAGTCFGVTAPDALRPAAEALVIEMGGEPVFISEQNRNLYHAALAGAANHLITLVAQAADLLRAAGVAEPARLLGPLLFASLDNALRFGDAGLTGPVARGDAETVAAHVAALESEPSASAAAVAGYIAMARLTADRALAAGLLKPADAERLLDVLGGRP
jgi:predicted short-subunit dehydrogenase-like oxidoreductase (DUF2520 family)